MTRPTGNQTRTFLYNTNGQMYSATNPQNLTSTYTYNTDGTLFEGAASVHVGAGHGGAAVRGVGGHDGV